MTTDDRTTLLIVDDNEGIRALATDVFSALGYEVLSAEDGTLALKLIDTCAIEAILCDVSMPHMDGLAFLQEIRSRSIDIPIVFLTGFSNINFMLEAIRLGAADFLVKPIDVDALAEVITRTIEMGRLQRKNRELIEAAVKSLPIREQETFHNNERMINLLRLVNNSKAKKAS